MDLLAGSGTTGKVDGRHDQCSFNLPRGITVHEASQSFFVVDTYNHAVRKVSFAKQ